MSKRLQGLPAGGECRGIWNTVPQFLLPICAYAPGAAGGQTAELLVKSMWMGALREGKGRQQHYSVRHIIAVGKCEETGAKESHSHCRILNRLICNLQSMELKQKVKEIHMGALVLQGVTDQTSSIRERPNSSNPNRMRIYSFHHINRTKQEWETAMPSCLLCTHPTTKHHTQILAGTEDYCYKWQ